MPAHLFLARHARPDWDRTDIPYHIPPGPPLTDLGLAEAHALGAFLKSAGVRKVYASPLERALHTAQIVCEILSAGQPALQPVILQELIEWQPSEETAQVARRMGPVVEAAAQESLALGPIALISHGGPVSAVLAEMGVEQAVIEEYKRQFDHANALPTAGAWEARRNGSVWALGFAFKPDIVLT